MVQPTKNLTFQSKKAQDIVSRGLTDRLKAVCMRARRVQNQDNRMFSTSANLINPQPLIVLENRKPNNIEKQASHQELEKAMDSIELGSSGKEPVCRNLESDMIQEHLRRRNQDRLPSKDTLASE